METTSTDQANVNNPLITLITSDNHQYQLKKDLALQSKTLHNFINANKEFGANNNNNQIDLPQTSSKQFSRLFELLNWEQKLKESSKKKESFIKNLLKLNNKEFKSLQNLTDYYKIEECCNIVNKELPEIITQKLLSDEILNKFAQDEQPQDFKPFNVIDFFKEEITQKLNSHITNYNPTILLKKIGISNAVFKKIIQKNSNQLIISCVRWNNDSSHLIQFDLTNFEIVCLFSIDKKISDIALNKSNHRLAIATSENLMFFDLSSNKVIEEAIFDVLNISALASNENILAVAQGGHITLYNISNLLNIANCGNINGIQGQKLFILKSNMLIDCSYEGYSIWDLTSVENPKLIIDHKTCFKFKVEINPFSIYFSLNRFKEPIPSSQLKSILYDEKQDLLLLGASDGNLELLNTDFQSISTINTNLRFLDKLFIHPNLPIVCAINNNNKVALIDITDKMNPQVIKNFKLNKDDNLNTIESIIFLNESNLDFMNVSKQSIDIHKPDLDETKLSIPEIMLLHYLKKLETTKDKKAISPALREMFLKFPSKKI